MKILFAILAYALGALPTGYIAFRLSENKDVRGYGSGNTGATNIMRLKGWKLAVPVVIVDILKGFLPAFLAVRLFGDHRLALVAAFLAIVGHCYPVYIGFRGGKGVATTVGAFAGIAPVPLVIAASIFLFAVALTRFVSLGSMLAAASFPVAVFLTGGLPDEVVWGGAVALLIVVRHHENIRRLLAGRERKLGEKAA
jgi:acyl phosphate:glycerol-3-phosphate acyltransferase